MDVDGYIKLTDMGIAKVVMGKTYTICGTVDYFAPETLKQLGHDRAVDWWALGVLLFIIATGRSPFDAPTVTQIYKNIMKGFSRIDFPDSIPLDMKEVIKSLCRKKPEERITMQKGGIHALMNLHFFRDFSWESLQTRTMTPPVLPKPFDEAACRSKGETRECNLNYQSLTMWDGSLPDLIDGLPAVSHHPSGE